MQQQNIFLKPTHNLVKVNVSIMALSQNKLKLQGTAPGVHCTSQATSQGR